MDALSDVLRVVRLKGGVFLHAEFTAPWCITAQVGPRDSGSLFDRPEHVLLFHYVSEGKLFAQIESSRPSEIEAGEIIIFPQNGQHLLGSHLDVPPVPTREIVQSAPESGFRVIHHGGGGEQTRIVCGFLGCDQIAGNPLLAALPSVLRFDTRSATSGQWVRSSLEFAAQESAARRAGTEAVLARLSEVLFIEALRSYVDALSQTQTGWLAGLKDPLVARALALLHGQIARQWTMDDLSREVGLSRSGLAERFTRLIGDPPIRYLSRWRIQVAAHQLRHSEATIARIAEDVGYGSEAAFNRAFKLGLGTPPATWRKLVRPDR